MEISPFKLFQKRFEPFFEICVFFSRAFSPFRMEKFPFRMEISPFNFFQKRFEFFLKFVFFFQNIFSIQNGKISIQNGDFSIQIFSEAFRTFF